MAVCNSKEAVYQIRRGSGRNNNPLFFNIRLGGDDIIKDNKNIWFDIDPLSGKLFQFGRIICVGGISFDIVISPITFKGLNARANVVL